MQLYYFFYIQVGFVGESAVDEGGPKREFFRLLAYVACTSLFKGGPSNPNFMANNTVAVQVSFQGMT